MCRRRRVVHATLEIRSKLLSCSSDVCNVNKFFESKRAELRRAEETAQRLRDELQAHEAAQPWAFAPASSPASPAVQVTGPESPL